MKKMLSLAERNVKEILRDPINLAFGLGFPLVLLVLMSIIQANVPVDLFNINSLTPGITVFGLSFMSLFSATMLSRDRGSSFLKRLYTTPLTARDFIMAYTLPVIPLAVGQSVVCYIAALFFGLKPAVNIFLAILFIIPVASLYIGIGLLCGSTLTDKQVGGICGALLANVSGWLSGIWFDLSLVGGVFKKIAYALPFVHAVEMEKAVLSGDLMGIFPHIFWVLGYSAVIMTLAVILFLRQMKRN